MGITSLTRHLSQALSRHDVEASRSESQGDEQPQRDRRSSFKASMYQHSPAHSGDTLHNLEHAPTELSADVLVHVMTVGDSVITIESQREDDQIEQTLAKRKGVLGVRRTKTAPASQTIPLHGSVTTIESIPKNNRLRAWSYPLASLKDNLIRRMRRGTDTKEALRGKASCELGPTNRLSNELDSAQDSTPTSCHLMSGACQGSALHVNLAAEECGISPRTSIDLDQDKRKDSHSHGVLQTKEQTSAEMEAGTKKSTPEEQPRKSPSFLLNTIDWIRQHRPSPVRASSASSSSSDSPLSFPVPRPARPPRRIQETHYIQAQPAVTRLPKASSCDKLYSDTQLNLPPGFEIPAEGQAGPVDWVHRGWEEHYRRSTEAAHRACHPLTAARSFPARNEDLQRYQVASTYQDGPQCRVNSTPYPTEPITQAWDFAVDGKGKGRRCEEDVDGRGRLGTREIAGAGRQRQRRRRSKGACVTTVTLSECDFAKELEQSAEQSVA